MIRMGLLGCRGRMGQWVAQLIHSEFGSQVDLCASVDKGDGLEGLLEVDVVVDFSDASSMHAFALRALSHDQSLPAFVIGSTGWTPQQNHILEKLSFKTPVFVSSNFSIGVFILSQMLKQFTPFLKKLGYMPRMIETHHQHKKDMPSGTALFLSQMMDPQQPVLIHSIRAGEVIGDHEISFYGSADQLTLGHYAQDRSVFARGALLVALWIVSQRHDNRLCKGMLGMEHYFNTLIES